MRRLLVGAPALLAACATPPAPTPVHGVTPGHKCDATGSDRFIGQPGTIETGAAIMRAAHAAVLRWAPPGYMLTMDYREDRVTVRLDPDRKVTAINCG
jgi:hypothetical protein